MEQSTTWEEKVRVWAKGQTSKARCTRCDGAVFTPGHEGAIEMTLLPGIGEMVAMVCGGCNYVHLLRPNGQFPRKKSP
jgi:hypothetical protein